MIGYAVRARCRTFRVRKDKLDVILGDFPVVLGKILGDMRQEFIGSGRNRSPLCKDAAPMKS